MTDAICWVAGGLGVAVVLGLFVGRFIRVGRGPRPFECVFDCRGHCPGTLHCDKANGRVRTSR